MTRRLLIAWLIITTLGYSLTLAANVHNIEMPDISVGIDIHSVDDHSDHPDSDTAQDHYHCGHGTSHLLGLHFENIFGFPIDRTTYFARHAISLIAPLPSRFIRPPRLT